MTAIAIHISVIVVGHCQFIGKMNLANFTNDADYGWNYRNVQSLVFGLP